MADDDAAAKPEPKAAKAAVAATADPVVEVRQPYIAIHAFKARTTPEFGSQLMEFLQGAEIYHALGKSLEATGAPVKPLA